MRYAQILLVATAWPCMGTTPAPFAFECSLLDRVSDAAKAGLPSRSIALEILERVGEARMDSSTTDLEAQVGLKPGQLHGREFKDSTVRAHALRRIGELDVSEALTYLLNLQRSDFESDTSGEIWPAAQIALRQAQLNGIPEEPAKIHFLEDTTSEKSAAASWAVDELCERGSYGSLGFIRASMRKRNSIPDSEKDIAFREGRMGVVSRNPDRLKALGSFLSVSGGVTDLDLIGWAISKLEAMKSPRADAELERYAKEIDALPEDSTLKRELESKRAHLRIVLPHPPK